MNNWLTGKRATASDDGEAPTLPKGFDDPDSEFHVPESLRLYYLETTDLGISALFDRSQQLARSDANLRVFSALPQDSRGARTIPEEFHKDVTQEQRALLSADDAADHYLALARHEHKLNEATVLAHREKERQRNEERYNKRMTCEICQEVHRTVKRRTIEIGNATSIRGCERCEIEITRLAHDALRQRLTPQAQRNVQTIVATITER